VAQNPEIIDPNDEKAIASTIHDIKIEDMLSKTAEFNRCRDMNKFSASDKDDAKKAKIQQAEKCFREQLDKGNKDPKKLEELANNLNLQTYGLIKTKTVKDIQKYLNDKMYKAMTGVSLEEKDHQKLKEDLKFGKRKHIDQGIFIQMYKTQLGKNAMFEVSRFCFENFRIDDPDLNGKKTFAEYWSGFKDGSVSAANLEKYTDTGIPAFGKIRDTSNKDQVYEDVLKSIQTENSALNSDLLSNFFVACGKMIPALCKEFEKNLNVSKNSQTTSMVDEGKKDGPSRGSAACLAKSRIQEFKRALINVDKVAEEFSKMKDTDQTIKLTLSGLDGQPLKVFGDGKDPNEETIDQLTSYTTKDVVEGGLSVEEKLEDKAKACKNTPELAKCEGFFTNEEDFAKVKHSTEMELTLRREVEMERVRKIVKDNNKDLEKYLEDNGYMDILKDYKGGEIKDADAIAERVGQSFESKKKALLEQLNNKLGKRQMSKTDNESNKQIAGEVDDIVKDTKEERARLAKVVLFNNIITSHITLSRKDGSPVGRNVGAWKEEEKDLASTKVNPALFQNLKASTDGQSGIGKNDQISGFSILDEILGKEKN
jgi:hypothetical protein